MHPNATDPVDDDAYPLVTAVDPDDDVVEPHAGWDTDPALAGTSRVAEPAAEPDEAWQLLNRLDAWGTA
jgi:hypothetical protein